ncbi:ligand-effect modulator 3 family [Aspergillus californicus]
MSHSQANNTESLSDQEHRGDADTDKKPKNKRPANTAFRQQRLKAWQPILTPKSVLPLFFVIGVIFAPIGGVLLWASSTVQELVLDYSGCKDVNGTEPISGDKFKYTFKSSYNQLPSWQRVTYGSGNDELCRLSFDIPDDMGPPVFMYYRLTNFYQNHRRYVKSLDLDQLKGKAVKNDTIDGGSCDPITLDDNKKAFYPCGLIANSMFNDTIYSPVLVNGQEENEPYNMTKKGIAWDSDKELIKKTKYEPGAVVPPPNWQKRYSYETEIPDLHEDEDFMVWMRTAALPTFSKLSRRNDSNPMLKGRYELDIRDPFPVTEYGGTKSIIITTRTVLGGQNPFMGIAYVVVGGVCVLLGALFTVAHLVRPRKLGDHTYLTWNNESEPPAATGRDERVGAHSR